MEEPDFDIAVIGGGVVGLAVGYSCASRNLRTVVLERHEQFCEEASTHNSSVIHSGFNPEPGTLKARLNLAGARLNYPSAAEWNFRVKRVGTLAVSKNVSQTRKLHEMKSSGQSNGVEGLALLSPRELKEYEPNIENAHSALLSPDGGVIDTMEFIARLNARAVNEGAVLAPGREVVGVNAGNPIELRLGNGESITSGTVVNSAGLHADDIAGMFGSVYRVYPCVGEYASVSGEDRSLVKGMVYPVVDASSPGLGIHLTKTIEGDLLFGPTAVNGEGKEPVEWRRTPLSVFVEAIRAFFPSVKASSVTEGWSGIRSKVVPPGSGKGYGDFIIEWDRRGCNVIHLIGIESPGLTASLAIGEHVAVMAMGGRPGSTR